MISVIICCSKKKLDDRLIENINCTLGLEYELIVLDNSEGNYSIFEAYNLGIGRSKFPILTFIHEDILFHSENWGSHLIHHFEEKKLGIIGIAGSKVMTEIPSSWWNNLPSELLMNIIQHSPEGKKERNLFGFKEPLEEVVVVDGVFMALRKDHRISFNTSLKGFHNYDQSICLDYRAVGYKIAVTKEILIEHFSSGTKDSKWLKSLLIFHERYKKMLPQKIGRHKITKKEMAFSCSRLIYNSIRLEEKGTAFRYWLTFIKLNPLRKVNYSLLKYFLNLTPEDWRPNFKH